MFNLFSKWSKTESPSYTPWYGDVVYWFNHKKYTPEELGLEFGRLQKEVEDAKLMSEERDNKWRTFNNSLHAQIKGLKEDNTKLKEGNSQWSKLYEDVCRDRNELEAVLHSIAEDGTHEHSNAIKLRQENAELKNELSLVEIEQEAIVDANHRMAVALKEKKDRIILLENAIDRWQSRAKSWEELDKDNEKLNLQVTALHKIIEGGKNTIDEQKAEIKKLKDDITNYVIVKNDENDKLKKELNHMKAVAEGAISLCDLSDKTDSQKHPTYPIHWGTIDSDIYEKAKGLSIEEAIGYDGAASAHPEEYSKWLNEQKNKVVEDPNYKYFKSNGTWPWNKKIEEFAKVDNKEPMNVEEIVRDLLKRVEKLEEKSNKGKAIRL